MPDKNITIEQARAAKPDAYKKFARFGKIVGVGITKIGGSYALKVNLQTVKTGAKLPTSVDGVPIQVEVVGTIVKRAAS